jgi:hypothetical protein
VSMQYRSSSSLSSEIFCFASTIANIRGRPPPAWRCRAGPLMPAWSSGKACVVP